MSAASASADIYTPTSESMSDPKISPAKNHQAAAIGRQDTIVVVPDDQDYAHAKPTKLALPFHIEAHTSKNKWRIKESYIVIGLAPLTSAGQVGSCCGSMAEFNQYNYDAAVDHGATEDIDRDAWWTLEIEGTSVATRARNACRKLRGELEDQGLTRDQIFGQDRTTTLPTDFRYVARVAHKNDNKDVNEAGASSVQWKQSQPSWANINVICQKGGPQRTVSDPAPKPKPTGSNDIAMGFQVNQAALAITPKDYEAKCPAKLHLNPTIEATGKGTVKYRFVDQLGNHSQTFQVKFDKSDVKFLDHVIEIDDKNAPKGLGFKAAQPTSGALGLAAPSDPNLTQGYFRVEVLSPHKKLSNIADYSVKCTVKTAGDGKVTTAPTDPTPGFVEGQYDAEQEDGGPGDRQRAAQPRRPDQAVREGDEQGHRRLHADQSQGAALGRRHGDGARHAGAGGAARPVAGRAGRARRHHRWRHPALCPRRRPEPHRRIRRRQQFLQGEIALNRALKAPPVRAGGACSHRSGEEALQSRRVDEGRDQ